MRVITIEEHITSEEDLKSMMESSAGDFGKDRMKFFMEKATVDGKLTDTENIRIPFMNKVGIDMQILSYINLASSNLTGEERTNTCIRGNDFLKEQTLKHPDRFGAFATLPLWDVEASVKELERCVKEYGFKGALVQGKVDGHFLDEKQYIPLFEKAEELDVPIYFHPSFPVKEIQDYYYNSKDGSWSNEVANEFSSAGFGWHIDIGIQVVRMILSGIFDRCPNLKIITGHWGEGMISMLDRMDYMMPKSQTGLKKNISEYYKDNIYVTPSGIESLVNLEAVTKYMGADHIIWAVDYPYLMNDTVVDFLMNSNLTDEEKELISHKNAEKLFKLN